MHPIKDYPIEIPDGWFYSSQFNHYQKVQNKVYCYVTPQLFGRWIAQVYLRGRTGLCELEARVHIDSENDFDYSELEKLFKLSELWLEKYGDNTEQLKSDPYHVFNPGGWRGKDITGKPLEYTS